MPCRCRWHSLHAASSRYFKVNSAIHANNWKEKKMSWMKLALHRPMSTIRQMWVFFNNRNVIPNFFKVDFGRHKHLTQPISRHIHSWMHMYICRCEVEYTRIFISLCEFPAEVVNVFGFTWWLLLSASACSTVRALWMPRWTHMNIIYKSVYKNVEDRI